MCHGKNIGHQFGCFPFAGKDVSHIINKIGHHMNECMGQFKGWIPHNLKEQADGYLITVPLPGRSKDDVKVTLLGNNLNIKASKPKLDEEENKSETNDTKPAGQRKPFFNVFYNFINVDLDIALPADADGDSIKSIMANGLLKIKVGKKPSKTININTEGNN